MIVLLYYYNIYYTILLYLNQFMLIVMFVYLLDNKVTERTKKKKILRAIKADLEDRK